MRTPRTVTALAVDCCGLFAMIEEMTYLGLDPGKSGAIAFLRGDEAWCIKCSETPADIADALREVEGPCFAIIERVHSMPRQGVSSTFKFGESFGLLQGLLVALQIPHEFVTPAKWQGTMGCRSGGDKNVTKKRAQELFPAIKVIHAVADALLLAEYCRRLRT